MTDPIRATVRRGTTPMTECRNPECGQPAPPDRKGWCTACYWHHRRHGTPRPTRLIERQYHRTLEQILANRELHA